MDMMRSGKDCRQCGGKLKKKCRETTALGYLLFALLGIAALLCFVMTLTSLTASRGGAFLWLVLFLLFGWVPLAFCTRTRWRCERCKRLTPAEGR